MIAQVPQQPIDSVKIGVHLPGMIRVGTRRPIRMHVGQHQVGHVVHVEVVVIHDYSDASQRARVPSPEASISLVDNPANNATRSIARARTPRTRVMAGEFRVVGFTHLLDDQRDTVGLARVAPDRTSGPMLARPRTTRLHLLTGQYRKAL